MNKILYIKCPYCGATLSLLEEIKNDKKLCCSKCNRIFKNTYKKDRDAAHRKKYNNSIHEHGSSNEANFKGNLVIFIIIIVLSCLGYAFFQNSIKVDGNTVYVMTKDLYAPSTESAAKKLIHSAVENQNDAFGQLEYVIDNSNTMVNLSKGDRVVVVKKTSSGYKIRRLSDFQTAIVPNGSYLKEE